MIMLRKQIALLEEQAKKDPTNAADGSDQEAGRKAEIANPVYERVKLNLVDAEMALASAQRRLQESEKAAAGTRRDRQRPYRECRRRLRTSIETTL